MVRKKNGGYIMKTIVCKFPSVDYGDLAAKELKEKDLIRNNIEINGTEDETDEEHYNETLNYFLIPAFGLNYNTSFLFPAFPGIIPYMNDSFDMWNESEKDHEEILFCATCRDEDVPLIESIILNHSGYDFKVITK